MELTLTNFFPYSYKENFLVYYVYRCIFKKGTKPLISGNAGNDTKKKNNNYISP